MSRALLIGVILLVAVGATALSTWRWASATGPDVNNDGQVRIDDILEVVKHYYEYVPTQTPPAPVTPQPTATPQPTPTPTILVTYSVRANAVQSPNYPYNWYGEASCDPG